jgi:monoamine oxidase
MTVSPQHDVIVVGAGLAGLRAARDLAEAGYRVLVLEARERVGGRGWTSEFPDLDADVELGGAWFTERHHLVREELGRYGLGTREVEPVTSTRWHTGGALRLDAPIPAGDEASSVALQRLQADADAMAVGDEHPRFSLSLDDYLDAIEAPVAARDLVRGWWSITGGAATDEGCVDALLDSVVSEGPIGDMSYLRYTPVPGWSALAEAFAATDGVDIEFGQPVSQVFHDDQSVSVRAVHASFTARTVVMAVPVNTLPDIRFTPSLDDRLEDAFGSNAGAATKVWMLARGVPERALAFGRGVGLSWVYGDRVVGDQTLVVGFGWPIDGFDPADGADVERALRHFFPDAALAAHTTHDWLTDPASLGTWSTPKAGQSHRLIADTWAPTGRLVFATSDVSAEHAGWFEGALVSGRDAARAVLALTASTADV